MSVLYVIATPIGNMKDVTLRALEVLQKVDILAAEDTRQTIKIFIHHGLEHPAKIVSCHEHNEAMMSEKLLAYIESGKTVGLCSDGGSPAISDPGYRVIDKVLDAGFPVEVIPGANAAIAALIASGLPTSSFTFKGFAPRKSGQRTRFLEQEKDSPHSLIFYESPYRIGKLLSSAFEVYGNRKAAVCRELTKKFEEIDRAYLKNLSEKYAGRKVKGEVTVVVAGNNEKFLASE